MGKKKSSKSSGGNAMNRDFSPAKVLKGLK
jgi:hypothetical protein